jgi:hypothetical protein
MREIGARAGERKPERATMRRKIRIPFPPTGALR